jgi:two-component system, NtrC family, sensor histidine kinase HydH
MKREASEARELKALVELSTLINSSLDIQRVLGHAMRCVQEFLDAEASSIFEIDSEKRELFFRLALGDAADRVREVRLKVGQGVAGWVAQTGQPLIIPDTAKDPRFSQNVDDHSGFKTRSIVCVPMVYAGQLTGVIEVLNKRSGREFNEDDQEILTVLANQIATAIENARLFQRLNERFTLTSSELRTTQEKLVQAERLAALGRLSQGVAHEVRNPVMVIGGFARRLRRDFDHLEFARKALVIILDEAARLEHMVVDIEDYCRLPTPTPRCLNLVSVLDAMLQGLADSMVTRGITVRVSHEEKIPELWADEKLLQIAFENILTNSMDAMPQGGLLEVELEPNAQSVSVLFRDNGGGISPDDLPNVMEPFFTSKTRGSGLGLTTVHRIVGDHGGDVAIRSTVGKGTEVEITLPLGFPECVDEAPTDQ